MGRVLLAMGNLARLVGVCPFSVRMPVPSGGSVQHGLSAAVHQRGLRLALARRLINAIRCLFCLFF